jgi:hypothetical protein
VDQHALDFAEPHAALRLGHEQAGHAHLGELLPQRARAAGLRLPQLAQRLGPVLLREEVAQRGLEQQLVFAEAEVHRYLGIPRMRSEMMLRWISLVPA